MPARCLLGYGLSDEAGDVSLGVHNRLLCDWLDHCGLGAPAIVGHDFGGTTVLRAHLPDSRDSAKVVLIEDQPQRLVQALEAFLGSA